MASLIPFDVFQALHGAPVVTRVGRQVTKLKSVGEGTYPLRGLVNGKSFCWTKAGLYWPGTTDDLDLFLTEVE